MKNIFNFFIVSGFAISLASCSGSSANVEKDFYVRGNCGMCEKRIEKTVMSVEGVESCDYDLESHKVSVMFDSTKTNEMMLHKAVAGVGHETKMEAMNEEAHENLPDCCKKEMAAH